MPQIGATGLTEQPPERRYDPRRGYVTVRRFRGDRESVLASAAAHEAAGYSTAVRGGPVWEVEATMSADDIDGGGGAADEPVDSWELQPNMLDVDILMSDASVITQLDSEDVNWLRGLLDGQNSADNLPEWKTANTTLPATVAALIVAGVKTIQRYAPTLRHTRTASSGYEVPASLANVQSVYATGALVTAEAVPASLANNLLPSSVITRTLCDVQAYFLRGWLKSPPSITAAAWNKIQIVQEWQYGDWAQALYTGIGFD